MEDMDGELKKISVKPTISLGFFIHNFLLFSFFSDNVENFISNNMSHQKFELDKNYKLFIGGII